MKKETNKKLFLIACLIIILNNRAGLLPNFPEQKEEEEERDDPTDYLEIHTIGITGTTIGTPTAIEVPIIPPFHF